MYKGCLMKFIKICLIMTLVFTSSIKYVKADNSLLMNAKSGLLMEVSTGTIIYEKNIHEDTIKKKMPNDYLPQFNKALKNLLAKWIADALSAS